MKLRTLAAIAAIGAGAMLAGCADDYAYGPRGAYAGVDYDGFYDDYYGPFNGGYWGPGGVFYYQGADGRHHRDGGHHFRQSGGDGFHPFHGHAPDAAPGRPGMFGGHRGR